MRGKMNYEDRLVSESGNWNVASDYAKDKIMRYLNLIDQYETLCRFGYLTLMEQFEYKIDESEIKIKSLGRFIQCLIMLIDNTIFAIKSTYKKDFEDHRKNLKKLRKLIPQLHNKITDARTKIKKITLNEESFENVLEKVTEIKSELNDPLNKSDLIFIYKEEFDEEKYKRDTLHELATMG